jgi:PucR family transcriptional regulator, purine catabolism regulatory protein
VRCGEARHLHLYTLEGMTVTVRELVEQPELGLRVVAGSRGLDGSIRFAHVSELTDPTPWLSGGELLLTTGMGMQGPPHVQADYVRRLVKANLAGLGLGVGFGFERAPAELARTAEAEGFPLLEVPYPVPFIAITEAISTRLAEERLRDAQTSVEVHERLTQMIADGTGPADVLDVVVSLTGGWAMLFDLKGGLLARSSAALAAPGAAEVWASLPPGLMQRPGPATASQLGPQGTRVAMGVVAGRRHEAVLVFGTDRRLEGRDRIVVRHAVTVLGLLLASRRAVIEAERRIAGDILSDSFAGRLVGADLERRLELVGFPAGAALTVLVVEPAEGSNADALDDVAWAADAMLGARSPSARTAVVGGRVAALVAHSDPPSLARFLAGELPAWSDAPGVHARLRVGVGSEVEAASIRHSYLQAVFALRAAPPGWSVASPQDLGSYGFLLGSQSRPVLEGFVASALGPLIRRDEARSSELVASVRAFIASGGRWEQGAEALGVHRHTLRYRIRQAEDLLGRDLSSAEDRLELWLALKALEVMDE